MENAAIAANLVRVPGYCYVDVPKSEVNAIVSVLKQTERQIGVDGFFAAVSAHGVVASDPTQNTARTASGGRETGFLVLYAFREAPPAGIDEQLAKATASGTPKGVLEISGTKVYRFENTATPDSRYSYSWLRHGVQGALDGADRAPVEKWLRRYLAKPVLVGNETSTLSNVLEPVPGYAYVNYASSSATRAFVTEPLGKVPSSLHLIADSKGAAGGLILAQAPASLTAAQYAAKLQRYGLDGYTSADSTTIGQTPVEHLTSSVGEAYVWVRDGTAGVLVTQFPDRTAPFLTAFLT